MSAADIRAAQQRLARAFTQGSLCPVLGAGSVYDLGLPLWTPMVKQLVQNCCRVDDPSSLEGQDAIHLFDLAALEPDRASHALQSILYTACPPLDDPSAPLHARHSIDPDSPAPQPALLHLALLATFVAFRAEDRPFHAITYNVDTLLEELITWLGYEAVAVVEARRGYTQKIHWRPSEEARRRAWSRERGQFKRQFRVRVFHPHGVVLRPEKAARVAAGEDFETVVADRRRAAGPADGKPMRPQIEDSTEFGLVFGRRHYNQLFGSLEEPRNRPQLAAFTHLHCLFYGMSFADPNVDRLLEVAEELRRQALLNGERRPMQHVRLARLVGDESIERLTAEAWEKSELDVREALRSSDRLGVETLFLPEHGDLLFPRHQRFVRGLLHEIATRHRYARPGVHVLREEEKVPARIR